MGRSLERAEFLAQNAPGVELVRLDGHRADREDVALEPVPLVVADEGVENSLTVFVQERAVEGSSNDVTVALPPHTLVCGPARRVRRAGPHLTCQARVTNLVAWYT